MRRVQAFALAAAGALEELVARLPDDVQRRLAEAVAGGAHLAVGLEGASVFLEVVDSRGERHRVCTVDPTQPRPN